MKKNNYSYSGQTVALFAALCIFLSTVEYMIPKPLPFLRLGLANLPLIIAVAVFKPSDLLVLAALKVFGQGMINGTLLSYIFLFSFSGTAASVLIMAAVYRIFSEKISLVGISVLGALSSNLIQLYLSKLFIFGDSVKYIAPPFLTVGLVSSVILGMAADGFLSASKWLEERRTA